MKMKKVAVPALVSALMTLAGVAQAAPQTFDFTGFHITLDNIIGLQNPLSVSYPGIDGIEFDVFSLDGGTSGASQTYSFDYVLTADPGWSLGTIAFATAGMSDTSDGLTGTLTLPTSFNEANMSVTQGTDWSAFGQGSFVTSPPALLDSGTVSYTLFAAPGTMAMSAGTFFGGNAVAVAVPEPTEWMLLLAGLGIVGGIARRRITT